MMAIGRIRQTLVARCQFNTLGCGRSSAGGGCLASVARPRIGVTFAAYADRDREEIFTVPYPYLSTLACVCGVSCAWMWFGLLGAAERSTALPRIALKQLMLILAFALIGWALCGAIIGIGRSVMSLATTLIVHAIGAALLASSRSCIFGASITRHRYKPP